MGSTTHGNGNVQTHDYSVVVYKFQRGLCKGTYYSQCAGHFHIRIGEDNDISALTKRKIKP